MVEVCHLFWSCLSLIPVSFFQIKRADWQELEGVNYPDCIVSALPPQIPSPRSRLMVWTHVHRRPDSIHVQSKSWHRSLPEKGSCYECKEELHQQKGTSLIELSEGVGPNHIVQ